jgi:hypothetical protein
MSRRLLKKKKFVGMTLKPVDSFFRAVQTLLYNQARSVLQSALTDYLKLFHFSVTNLDEARHVIQKMTHTQRSPKFSIRLDIDRNKREVVFDPPFEDLQEVLLDSIRFILTTLESVPDVEYALYNLNAQALVGTEGLQDSPLDKKQNIFEDHPGFIQILNESKLKSVLLEENFISKSYQAVKDYSQNCFAIAKEYFDVYRLHCELFSEELEKSIEHFLESSPTFEECIEVLLH